MSEKSIEQRIAEWRDTVVTVLNGPSPEKTSELLDEALAKITAFRAQLKSQHCTHRDCFTASVKSQDDFGRTAKRATVQIGCRNCNERMTITNLPKTSDGILLEPPCGHLSVEVEEIKLDGSKYIILGRCEDCGKCMSGDSDIPIIWHRDAAVTKVARGQGS